MPPAPPQMHPNCYVSQTPRRRPDARVDTEPSINSRETRLHDLQHKQTAACLIFLCLRPALACPFKFFGFILVRALLLSQIVQQLPHARRPALQRQPFVKRRVSTSIALTWFRTASRPSGCTNQTGFRFTKPLTSCRRRVVCGRHTFRDRVRLAGAGGRIPRHACRRTPPPRPEVLAKASAKSA